jgi:hypothetical protein
MTEADKPAFWAELQRLGVAFGAHIDGPLGKVYWDALVDLELAPLAEGMRDCIEAMKFFPKVADLRDAEFGARARREQAQTQRLLAAMPDPTLPDDPRYYCANCEDTGFERGLGCPGDGRCHVGRCGQAGHASDAHGFTRPCYCRPTNPVLARQREVLRQNRARKEER